MLVIGEKINGTREEVARAIAERDETTIQRLALHQESSGADYLDINAGTHPDKEPGDMVWLIRTVRKVTADIGLCLDSVNPEALVAAMKELDDTPMINSLSGEKKRLENVLPIAARYRTPLILLALDDDGIPKTADGRMEIIRSLIGRARESGLADDKLYVDPLITTIATDRSSAIITLDIMRRVRSEFPDAHLVCGLSNISFGQPKRSIINQAFASLAIFSGLDAAIIDPGDRQLAGTILAAEMLLGKDPNCLRYNNALRSGLIDDDNVGFQAAEGGGELEKVLEQLVSAMASAGILDKALRKHGPEAPAVFSEPGRAKPPAEYVSVIDQFIDALVNMKEDEAMTLSETHLSSGGDPLALLDASREAMVKVGDLFEKREYFVPELMLAGEMLNKIAEAVKPHLESDKEDRPGKGRVIIGTVEGDIHDIGKDIVVTMLDINGYEVLDLGVDVPVEKFCTAAREFKPQVIGLSGFLTLAYEPMKETIAALRKDNSGVKYMIGGGQMDEKVSRYVNADAFGKDALEAVKLCDEWIAAPNTG